MKHVENPQPVFQGLPLLDPFGFYPQLLLGPNINLSAKQVDVPYSPSVFLLLCPNFSLNFSFSPFYVQFSLILQGTSQALFHAAFAYAGGTYELWIHIVWGLNTLSAIYRL